MKPNNALPSPNLLLLEARGAEGLEAPLKIDDYASVIAELREKKNFSYQKIADWLSERLGREVNKGMVYRAYENLRELRELQAMTLDVDIDEPEEKSIEEEIAEATAQLEAAILPCVLEKARGLGITGSIIEDALRNVAAHVAQVHADEKAATEADMQKDEGKSS